MQSSISSPVNFRVRIVPRVLCTSSLPSLIAGAIRKKSSRVTPVMVGPPPEAKNNPKSSHEWSAFSETKWLLAKNRHYTHNPSGATPGACSWCDQDVRLCCFPRVQGYVSAADARSPNCFAGASKIRAAPMRPNTVAAISRPSRSFGR